MPVGEEIKAEQRANEIYDMAAMAMVVNLGVSEHEAGVILLQQAASRIGNAAARAALKAK